MYINAYKSGKNIRPGKGKMRGRKYKVPVGPLIVVKDKETKYKLAEAWFEHWKEYRNIEMTRIHYLPST